MEWCTNAASLAASFRCRDLGQSEVALASISAKTTLGIPPDFEKSGPATKIRIIERGECDHSSLILFLNTCDQLNTIRQVQDSPRSVASGVHCWASFFDLINAPYFPPTSENVLRWGTLFNPGRTFGLYISHLPKACQLLPIPPLWLTNAVRGVARGLENAQDFPLKFENYMSKSLFRALISREPHSTECGRLFYLPYLFIPRLPSEALPARRDAPGASLLSRRPLPHQSVLGLRTMPDGQQCLVLKLRTRKHVRSGAVLFRPCFCNASVSASSGLCPIRDFWRIVSESCLPDTLLSPSLINRNINRILKGTIKTMEI